MNKPHVASKDKKSIRDISLCTAESEVGICWLRFVIDPENMEVSLIPS
jgi:hypothetical protein